MSWIIQNKHSMELPNSWELSLQEPAKISTSLIGVFGTRCMTFQEVRVKNSLETLLLYYPHILSYTLYIYSMYSIYEIYFSCTLLYTLCDPLCALLLQKLVEKLFYSTTLQGKSISAAKVLGILEWNAWFHETACFTWCFACLAPRVQLRKDLGNSETQMS